MTDGGASPGQDSFAAVTQFFFPLVPVVPPPDCSSFPPTPAGSISWTGSGVNDLGDVVVHDAVTDTTPPVLTVPTGITVNATSLAGARVTYTASATDNLDPTPEVICNPTSGSTFPIGTTKVTCTATDGSGNKTTKSFNVVVRLPTSKEECTNGGWRNFGSIFKSQGDCVSFVATGGKNPPGRTTP
ncbi:MAG: HYR domain-containing protein [Thermoleophilaceae bacterium]|nr:HYR domain-containing protein [Thermoleophilaceae bacterium]